MGRLYLVVTGNKGFRATMAMRSADEIINAIDALDTSDVEIYHVYDVSDNGELMKLFFEGPGRYDDPLHIAAYNPSGELVFSGYGSEYWQK